MRTGLLISMLLAVQPCVAAEVSVAVAANFTDAARDIGTMFEKESGHRAIISYGSTGKLYAQIENGAPFELFLAADSERPYRAEQQSLAVAGSRFTYAQGKLVLWSAKPGLFKDAELYLRQAHFHRIAIANPKTAPYGLASLQLMQHLGLWEKLQGKVVRGDSIAQTFQFIATGNAEAGFVAASQVRAWQDGSAGSVWEIPQAYYAPIDQQAVLLEKGRDNPTAIAFLEFLKSDRIRAVISAYGYGLK